MSGKQLFSIIMMVFWVIVMIAMAVRMVMTGDYRLWAAELAVLCVFAAFLRMYALEWRRRRDEEQGR